MVAHSAIMGGVCPIPVLRELKIGGREGGDKSCIPCLIFSIYKNLINVFKILKQEESSKTHVFIGNSVAVCFTVCSGKSQEVNSQKKGDLGAGEAHHSSSLGHPFWSPPHTSLGSRSMQSKKVCEQNVSVVCSRPDTCILVSGT